MPLSKCHCRAHVLFVALPKSKSSGDYAENSLPGGQYAYQAAYRKSPLKKRKLPIRLAPPRCTPPDSVTYARRRRLEKRKLPESRWLSTDSRSAAPAA